MKNNIWEWQAKDKDGKVVETAPGMSKFNMRGPGTLPDLIASANLLLYTKRLDVIRVGLPDPGYVVDLDSIKPLGHTDVTDENLGRWAPTNAVPLSLPSDPAVRAAHMKLVAEKLGVQPVYELDRDGNMILPPEPTRASEPAPPKQRESHPAPQTPAV